MKDHVAGGLRHWMPSSEAEVALLESRAKTLAAQELDEKKMGGETFLRFYLGSKEQYGIPYECLDEILPCKIISKVPCAPDYIAGIIDRRGELLTVMDPKQFFHLDTSDASKDINVVVVKQNKKTLGLLVNEIAGQEEYHLDQLTSPLEMAKASSMEYVKGIWQGKIAILNIPFLFLTHLEKS